jgi:hypothetical protein
MRKLIFITIIGSLLTSCVDEQGADSAKPDTFVKYFNGGSDDVALEALQTPDQGIVILANTSSKLSETSTTYKIKLIKTDEFGNELWTKFYPEFGTTGLNYKANAVTLLSNGSLVVAGESLVNNKSQLLLLEISSEGDVTRSQIFSSTLSTSGYAIASTSNDDYLVLSNVNSPTINMSLCEIDRNAFTVNWSREYGASKGKLARKLFLDGSNRIFWGGSIENNNHSSARFIRVAPDAEHTDIDLPIGVAGYNEPAVDMIRVGNGFALIGITNRKTSSNGSSQGDDDILFRRISDDGSQIFQKSYPIDNISEEASSINTTSDGGFVILGNIETTADNGGRGEKDYQIIRTDAFGNSLWSKVYGSKFLDAGAHIMELPDHSILVLGTTKLGGLNTIMLMKLDQNGELE